MPAKPSDLPAAVRFCRRHFPHMEGWGRRAAEYISYYIRAGLCAINRKGRRVVGIVIGRPVLHVEQCVSDRYSIDWDGDVLWVELVAGSLSEALTLAVAEIERMTGRRLTQIAWNRASRINPREKPIVFRLDRFFQRINQFQSVWDFRKE